MAIEAIMRTHFLRYPAMQIQDVYKLIHQASLGSEHVVSNSDSARKWMEHELAEMGEGPAEPVVDPISADDQIVRVHLRPYVAKGGDQATLLDAFIRTANEYCGDKEVLKDHWNTVIDMKYFPFAEMDGFIKSMQVQNYPAVHHSPEYERLYRPTYRVVWRKFIL